MQLKKATRLSCDNFRIQAVILEYEDCKLLIINTYFPCDSQKLLLTDTESSELHTLLNSISSLKQEHSRKFDTSIVLGDLNFDDIRYTGHTQAVNNFLEKERICSTWDSFPVDFTFASGASCSTLDHFLISNTQLNIVLDAGVLHDPDNVSGHSPIYLKIDLAKANNPPEEPKRNPRLNWGRSSEEQKASYSQHLSDILSQLPDQSPCQLCTNLHCDQDSHFQEIDSLTSDLLGSVAESAWENLEATQGTTGDPSSRKFTIPDWNDMVKPVQSEARFW